jgi:hypothetical protein
MTDYFSDDLASGDPDAPHTNEYGEYISIPCFLDLHDECKKGGNGPCKCECHEKEDKK